MLDGVHHILIRFWRPGHCCVVGRKGRPDFPLYVGASGWLPNDGMETRSDATKAILYTPVVDAVGNGSPPRRRVDEV